MSYSVTTLCQAMFHPVGCCKWRQCRSESRVP